MAIYDFIVMGHRWTLGGSTMKYVRWFFFFMRELFVAIGEVKLRQHGVFVDETDEEKK